MLYNRKILKKLDPKLIKSMKEAENEIVSVILYSQKDSNLIDSIDSMGISLKCELPIINGYCLEVPLVKLQELASLEQVKYIAIDFIVETQDENSALGTNSNANN